MSDKEHYKVDEKSRLTEGDNLDKEKVADGTVVDGQTPTEPEDEAKVKFIGNGGASPDECKVEMVPQQETTPENNFTGLTKEELQKFADDPFWVKVRWVLLILFWVAWIAMLAAAIVIIVLAPKCPPRPKLEWYQKESSYQCFPRSFKDSNDDGIGDINGIKEKLKYVKDDLRAKTLRINSVLKSGKVDIGNEVEDLKAIDEDFGTMEEFEHMRIDLHKKGMKLIMDFVPNHGSVHSTWFQQSSANKNADNKYRDYFIWADGKGPDPPNNWLNVYGESAWTKDAKRGQYYYHSFSSNQPDYNLYNPDVRKEVEDAMKFWLDKGVDGLQLVGAAHLFESNDTSQNEPAISGKSGYDSLNHTLTKYRPDTFKILTEWRKIFDEVSSRTDKPRAMIVDSDGGMEATKLMEYMGEPGAHLVTNPLLSKIDKSFTSKEYKNLVKQAVSEWPQGKTTSWMLGNANINRIASRVDEKYLNAVQMMFMTLPGTRASYYGEEIGMTDYPEPQNLTGRADAFRTPMQWTNEDNAGFTKAGVNPWLPINPNYKEVNVKSANAAGAGHNHFRTYKDLVAIREKESFVWGELHIIEADKTIFSYVRQAKGFPGYLVALNMDNKSVNVDFRSEDNKKLVAETGKVVANTGDFSHDDFKVNNTIGLDNVILNPGEGVVFEWPPEDVNQQM